MSVIVTFIKTYIYVFFTMSLKRCLEPTGGHGQYLMWSLSDTIESKPKYIYTESNSTLPSTITLICHTRDGSYPMKHCSTHIAIMLVLMDPEECMNLCQLKANLDKMCQYLMHFVLTISTASDHVQCIEKNTMHIGNAILFQDNLWSLPGDFEKWSKRITFSRGHNSLTCT